MIRLIRENVERIAIDEEQAVRLEGQGYKRLGCREEQPQAAEGSPVSGSMTVAELRRIARERGIGGASSLNKKELLEILEG